MNLLLGALSEGLILTPLALGLFLSYRVFAILDLTVDGAFGVGAALAAALLVHGGHPLLASLGGAGAGLVAGGATGLVHTRFRINASLASVLVTTALYSVMLFIMGGGDVPLGSVNGIFTAAATAAERQFGLPVTVTLLGTEVSGESVVTLVMTTVLATGLTLGVIAFLRTDLGLALRAAGSSPQMARSIAVPVDRMLVLGLALANGLVALSGALLAQFQGFANVQVGVGMVVTGLATLLLGEALVERHPFSHGVLAALVGAVAYRLLIALAIRAGLDPNALKLITALLVLLVLLSPRLLAATRARLPQRVERHA
jgi:putative ABC transport system permease protein